MPFSFNWVLVAGAVLCGHASAQSVLTYHNHASRSGAYVAPGLTTTAAAGIHLDPSFAGTVSGHVYAQPLYWQAPGASHGQVIVVTENNVVTALDGVTGAATWSTTLAAPVPLSTLPCGNIDPEGITGTPVIDARSGTLYLNALVEVGTGSAAVPRQQIFAVSLQTGKVLAGWPLDVQAGLAAQNVGFSSATQGQRSALLEAGGELYVAYGGKAGDCGSYHGTVVQVHTATAAIAGVFATRANGGGIWSQGGIAQNGPSLLVATGNTFGATAWSDGEAIFRLRAGLARPTSTADYFAPANWKTLDNEDADLGGTEALPISVAVSPGHVVNRVISFGKDGNAYLLSDGNLGGVGGPAVVVPVANRAIITGPAVYAGASDTLVALTASASSGCSGQSVIVLKVTAHSSTPISQLWCQAMGGRTSPIITTTDGTSNPIVWVTGAEADNLLHGYDAMTGQVLFAGGQMTGLRHFQTILAAGGHLYVASDNRIYAFIY